MTTLTLEGQNLLVSTPHIVANHSLTDYTSAENYPDPTVYTYVEMT